MVLRSVRTSARDGKVVRRRLRMRTASLFLCAAALAGCAPLSQAFRSLPAAPPAGRNVTFYRIVYNFKGAPDGAAPLASLLFVHNKFYGTTLLGGDRRCAPAGCGVVFETTVDGVERVLYRFAGGTDGAYPVAELTASGTLLYGTTTAGGARCDAPGRCGTIFTISPSGDERILHRFKGGRDGASPYGGLTPLGGNFYGSTYAGGGGGDCSQRGSGCGTIFIAGKEGTERVLYAFKGGSDGANPDATLFAYDDALYGTTESGGSRCGTGHGCGVAFSASTSGGEHVLHRFDG